MLLESGEMLYLRHRSTIERVIEYVCGRHHLTADDAEEFAGEVRLRLVENDYAVLRKHEGRSKLSTYLVVVVQRLLLDHRIRSWGKWRPSAEARRAGPAGIVLDQLLTRDGLAFDDAYAILTTKFQGLDRARLEQLAVALPSRARRRFEPEDALLEVASHASTLIQRATCRPLANNPEKPRAESREHREAPRAAAQPPRAAR